MNTLNKKQLYKFVENRVACRSGLKRLRHHMKTKTAREIIDFYRSYFLQSHGSYPLFTKGIALSSDYKWLCNSIGLLCYDAPTAKDIISKINDLRCKWEKY